MMAVGITIKYADRGGLIVKKRVNINAAIKIRVLEIRNSLRVAALRMSSLTMSLSQSTLHDDSCMVINYRTCSGRVEQTVWRLRAASLRLFGYHWFCLRLLPTWSGVHWIPVFWFFVDLCEQLKAPNLGRHSKTIYCF